MSDLRVFVIFDPEFGPELRDVPMSAPIWIVESFTNNPIIAECWQEKLGNITSFRPQSLGQLIYTVDQHHPGWRELNIIGSTMENDSSALDDYGTGSFEPTARGFTFRRLVS